MADRGAVTERIMAVFSSERMTVPEALTSLSDTILSMFLAYGDEPGNRDHLLATLATLEAEVLCTYDEFVADGGMEEVSAIKAGGMH